MRSRTGTGSRKMDNQSNAHLEIENFDPFIHFFFVISEEIKSWMALAEHAQWVIQLKAISRWKNA